MEVRGHETQTIFCSFYSVLEEVSRRGAEGKLDGRMICVMHGTDLEEDTPKFKSVFHV